MNWDLKALLSSGMYDFLSENRLFVDQQLFVGELCPPSHLGLAEFVGCRSDHRLVYMGQQVYVDYRHTTLSKIITLEEVARLALGQVFPLHIWCDTDRAGSDKLMTRIQWPMGQRQLGVSIASPGVKDRELRYGVTGPTVLRQAIDRVGTFLLAEGAGSKIRLRRLRRQFLVESPTSLRDFNLSISRFLLKQCLGVSSTDIFVSAMLRAGMISEGVNRLLNALDDFVAVFNEEVVNFTRHGLAVPVSTLPMDYLPLYYSCPIDCRRIKLRLAVRKGAQYAVGRCRCGYDVEFYLGSKTLDGAAITATDRWSIDVTLPLLLNRLVSGVVLGKSSALYGMVLNRVMSRVFGEEPVPGLIPRVLGCSEAESDCQADSLIYRYLTGSEAASGTF